MAGEGRIESINAVTLVVTDMGSATDFYLSLGFEKAYGGPGTGFTSFRLGNQKLNLIEVAGEGSFHGWGRVILYVDDVDAMHDKAVAAGLSPEGAPADASWGERYFHLQDPDGHELSFARPL